MIMLLSGVNEYYLFLTVSLFISIAYPFSCILCIQVGNEIILKELNESLFLK